MGIYLSIFSVLMLFALLEKRKLNNENHTQGYVYINDWNIKLVLFGIIIVVIAGIRWQIGTDWEAFLYDFRYMSIASWKEINSSIYGMTYGKAYVSLTYFFAKYVGNYSLYLTFQSILIVMCVYPVIYKYSQYPSISFLGLFSYTMGYAFAVPRSGIAMAICYRVFDSYLEKKYIRSFLLIILAASFHNTAILFIFIFVLEKTRLTVKKVIIMGSMSVILSFFVRPIFLKLAALPFIPLSYSMRINIYIMNNPDYGGVSGIIRVFTRGFVIILIFLYLWNKRGQRKINLIVNMYLFSIFIYILVSNISEVFMRLAYNFEDVSQFVIFSECVASTKSRNTNLSLKIVMIIFFFIKFLSRLIGSELIVPFKTVFQASL